jgi:hypothetical protein
MLCRQRTHAPPPPTNTQAHITHPHITQPRPPDNVPGCLELHFFRLEQRMRPRLVIPQLNLQPPAVFLRARRKTRGERDKRRGRRRGLGGCTGCANCCCNSAWSAAEQHGGSQLAPCAPWLPAGAAQLPLPPGAVPQALQQPFRGSRRLPPQPPASPAAACVQGRSISSTTHAHHSASCAAAAACGRPEPAVTAAEQGSSRARRQQSKEEVHQGTAKRI